MAHSPSPKHSRRRGIQAARSRGQVLLAVVLCMTLAGCSNDYVSLQDIPQSGVKVAAALPVSAARSQGGSNPAVVSPAPQRNTVPSTDGGQGALFVPPSEAVDLPVQDAAPETIPVTAEQVSAPAAASAPAASPMVTYYTQSGDTLPAVAFRFGVPTNQIIAATALEKTGFLDPNILLMIPPTGMKTSPTEKLMPDSEVLYSPSAIDFDINRFVVDSGGYLATYREYLNSTGWLSGAGVIRKIAIENSINPRVLLSLLQYRSNWVTGQPADQLAMDYPLGHVEEFKKGLYAQLTWAVSQLSYSYYGWQEGSLTDVPFEDGTTLRAAPELNAGSFALLYLFGQLVGPGSLNGALYGSGSYPALHQEMFGDPWNRAAVFEPLFPATLKQPDLILPIEPGVEWAFTGGPHSAWGKLGARAALDLAPADTGGCSQSNAWVLAAASGIVARSGGGVVVLDLDGDGNEQTGWDLFYMHIASEDRPAVGTFLDQGDHLGHPSCEGGVSTGTHFHLARKYNGEWILAGGPLPFDLDGWIAAAAPGEYKGTLTREDRTITARTSGTSDTYIVRDSPEPN